MAKEEIALFDHPLDIQRGYGRIIYAEAIDSPYLKMPAGWVLPGGERTNDKLRAELTAAAIHDLTTRQLPKKDYRI